MNRVTFHTLHDGAGSPLREEAAAGLLRTPATVAPKFFYDTLGSRLFEAITELDEYYPTRTEAVIFERHGADIARAVHAAAGPAPALVDLGAGTCAKAAALFPVLRPSAYVAVDIAVDFLRGALQRLQGEHPGIRMAGVGVDFSAALRLPQGLVDGPALVFYPGSSLGNFAPDDALRLLREARAVAAGGALLLGLDLLKPAEVLQAAYDDALGVTAAFNRNALRHLNRVLGSDFTLADWDHVALFDGERSRVEMHLQARRALTVAWPGGERRFAEGERIHTENAHKWTRGDAEALLRDAGFKRVSGWSDDRGWFAVLLAEG